MRPRRWVAAGLLAAALAAALASCGPARADEDRVRTVRVRIHHSRFEPASFDFATGETVRFVVTNTDPIDHEFIIGDEIVQLVHERGTEAYHPPRPGEMTVPAGTTATTAYTFAEARDLILGCHLPGHYRYGMRAPIHVG